MAEYSIEYIMEQAIRDSIIPCMYCGYDLLEVDYDVCPECGRENPLPI